MAAAVLGRRPPGEAPANPYLVDIFGLGAILYHLLTGRPLYSGKDAIEVLERAYDTRYAGPRDISSDIPADVEAALKKALERDPARRYRRAGDFASELNRLHETYGTDPAAPPTRRPGAAKTGGKAVVALVCIAIGSTAAAVGWWHRPRAGGNPPPAARPGILVREMAVEHFANLGDRDKPQGDFGESSFAARPGDSIRFRAELSGPAYCFVVAFRADGVDEVRVPARDDVAPEVTARLAYPAADGTASGLDEGAGFQAIFLVVSRHRLPSYARWKAGKGGRPPWGRTAGQPDVVWFYRDGRLAGYTPDHPLIRGHPGFARGPERALRGGAEMVRLAEWLREGADLEAVEGIGFAVLPK